MRFSTNRPTVASAFRMNPLSCRAVRLLRFEASWRGGHTGVKTTLYFKNNSKREAIHPRARTLPATYLHVPSQRHPNIKAETERRGSANKGPLSSLPFHAGRYKNTRFPVQGGKKIYKNTLHLFTSALIFFLLLIIYMIIPGQRQYFVTSVLHCN